MQGLRHLNGLGYISLFFALVGFVLGFWMGFSFQRWRLLLVAIAFLPFLFASIKQGKGNVVVLLLSVSIGLGLSFLKGPEKEGRGTYQGFVLEAKKNYFIYASGLNRYYVYEKGSLRETGDRLRIEGNVIPYESVEYESRFSFKDYLASKGVKDQLYAYRVEELFKRPLRLREKEVAFLGNFSSDTSSLIDGLLFSHQDYSSGLTQTAASMGCLYFLSLSGVLYGGFLRGVEKVFSLRFKEKTARFVAWVIGLVLLPFGLGKIGIWRVFLTRSYHLYLEKKKAEAPPHFFVLSFVGILSIVVNPFNALDTGFLLGYGLSFALGLSRESFLKYPGKKRGFMTSLFVLLFMTPVLVSKGAFHLLAGLYGALLLPLIYPFAFLSFVSFLSVPFVKTLNAYSQGISGFVGFLEKGDLLIPLGMWGEASVFLFYLCFCLFYYFREFMDIPGQTIVSGILALVVIFETLPLGNGASQEVAFINVGQGDAIVIRNGYSVTMIDTGGNLSFDMAQEVDIPYLRKQRIHQIDCLIASHGDYDHIGAASSLSKHFPVRRYVDSKASFPLAVGDLLFENHNRWGGSVENEESLVISCDFMGKKWLFTGDCPTSIEKKILAEEPGLDIDVLKVGHHGSKSSSSEAFLKQITPEIGIISVGKKNHYGHPDKEVLERFAALKIPLRRTDEEGTISYKSYFGKALGRLSS